MHVGLYQDGVWGIVVEVDGGDAPVREGARRLGEGGVTLIECTIWLLPPCGRMVGTGDQTGVVVQYSGWHILYILYII